MSQKELFILKGENWEITPYGEFISYHHAHNQILNNLLDLQVASENEIKLQKQKVKQFLRKNIKKIDHFVEYTQDIANFVSMTEEEFNQYMMKHFVEVLKNIQDEMEKQFTEKSEFERISEYFNSEILEGILKNVQEFSLKKKIFAKDSNDFFYIENKNTQEKIYSNSAKIFQENKTTTTSPNTTTQEKVYIPEKPILEDILTNFGDELTGETLILKKTTNHQPIQNDDDESDLISDFDDFEFEEEVISKEEEPINEKPQNEEISTEELEYLEENNEHQKTENKKEQINFSENEFYQEEDSLNNSISELQKEFLEEEEIEQIQNSQPNDEIFEEKAIISFIEYIQLSNLNRKNKKLGIDLYKKWLLSLSKEQLGIIFIEDQLTKKISENEWDNALSKISKQVNLPEEELAKIKKLVLLLFQLKRELEMFLNLCKKDHSSTIPIFQKNWHLFLQIVSENIQNQKIDFQKIEIETLSLLDESNTNEVTFRKIFQYWLENRLKKEFD